MREMVRLNTSTLNEKYSDSYYLNHAKNDKEYFLENCVFCDSLELDEMSYHCRICNELYSNTNEIDIEDLCTDFDFEKEALGESGLSSCDSESGQEDKYFENDNDVLFGEHETQETEHS